jgi:hypothetical protein
MKNLLKLLMITTLITTIACEKKKDEESNVKVNILPLLLPAVKETLPNPASTTTMMASPKAIGTFAAATSTEALSDFFSKSFTGISGVTGTGFVGTSIADLDSRITEINQRFESEPSCFTSTPYEWVVSPGAPVSPVSSTDYQITLKLNCLSMFTQTNGDQSGAGSGMAWGRDDNYYYIALLLVQSNETDKFGYFATYNRTTKAVDLLFLESSPSYDRYTVYRVKTDPTTSTFETAIAGAGFSEGPMFPALGCNTRIISNGTEMLVAGKAGSTNAAGQCQSDSSWVYDSNNCYNPADLSVAPTACSTLTTSSFSAGLTEFDGTQVYIARTNLTTNLTLSGLEGNVTPVQ